jgi:hypothetical protein
VLCHEFAWFILAAVRTPIVTKMRGGMSELMGTVLKAFFIPHDLRMGALVKHKESYVMIFCAFGIKVADEDAHHKTWLCKGASGTKPCMLCVNVVARSSMLHLHDDSGSLVPSTCIDVNKFAQHSDKSLRRVVKNLSEEVLVMSKGDFAIQQQLCGFVHNAHNMLLDPELDTIVKPASCVMWDWMHCYVVNGIWNRDLHLLLWQLPKQAWANLHEFLQLWTWPSALSASTGRDAFAPKRRKAAKDADHFKCSASEALSLSPVIAKWVKDVTQPAGQAPEACRSFLMVDKVLRILQTVTQGILPERVEHWSNVLAAAVHAHGAAYKAAHGEEAMLPKMHYAMHLSGMLLRQGMLLSCFVHERKHKLVKRYANTAMNTQRLEMSIMREVMLQHIHDLQHPGALGQGVHLDRPLRSRSALKVLSEHFPHARDVRISAKCTIHGLPCKRGDAVAFDCEELGDGVGQLWLHASVDGEHLSCISIWPATDAKAGKYMVESNPQFMPSNCIVAVVVYCKSGDTATVIF